jgi:hypothetical protein
MQTHNVGVTALIAVRKRTGALRQCVDRVLSAGVRDDWQGSGLGSTRAAYVQARRSVGYAVERRNGEN